MGQAQSNLSEFYPDDRNHDGLYTNGWRYTIRSISITNRTVNINKNQYHIDRMLGKGGFGEVYAARHLPTNKSVAIKVVSLATRSNAEAESISRSVLTEIQMAKRLAKTSEHIVHMYDFDFDREKGLTYIVMELGQQDLEKALSKRPPLSSAERKAIWRQLVSIAITLHNRQIVHLDIKPLNLVVFPGNVIKLVDLGIAQKVHQKRYGPNGTRPYSAPEVVDVSYSHMSMTYTTADIWSWGAVLYRMTYNQPPDYNYTPPCYHPPANQQPTRDPHLLDILRHTLVIDPRGRPDARWLAQHPYTRTHTILLLAQIGANMYAHGAGTKFKEPQIYPYVPQNRVYYTIQSISLINQTIPIHKNRYHFERKLGDGGFGEVYATQRLSDGRRLAVKVASLATMYSGEANGLRKSFLNEVLMAKRLAKTSRHIVHMYDFDFHQTGLTFIVMELGQQDLEKALINRPALLPVERKAIWRQLVNIAVTLYNRQIVHLDIKPKNLVIFPGNVIKLVDLGFAQEAYQTRIGPRGTIPYSAPEVTKTPFFHKKMTTTKADVWSWGAVLYSMTYNQPPDYNYTPPCYRPPANQYPARDSYLLDVLRHTLVNDPRKRCDTPWLTQHPYTRKV